MATTGELSGNESYNTSKPNDSGIPTNWSNPNNVLTNNGSDATCNASNIQGSNYLDIVNFGSILPSDSTVQGLIVRVEASETSLSTTSLQVRFRDNSGLNLGNPRYATIDGSSKNIYTLGHTTDLWNITGINRNTINQPNFGVRIWFSGLKNVQIDYVTLEIYYSVPLRSGSSVLRLNLNNYNIGYKQPTSYTSLQLTLEPQATAVEGWPEPVPEGYGELLLLIDNSPNTTNNISSGNTPFFQQLCGL